jgi:iron complex transport system permease protein
MARAPLTARSLASALAGGLVLCLACMAVGTCLGPAGFHLSDLARLFGPDNDVLLEARLPRVILGAVTGAALAMAGAALQALLCNPLADPFIVGVSGGAALGGTVALVVLGHAGVSGLGWLGSLGVPVGAYAGALAVLGLIYAAASVSGRASAVSVLLSGVVFNAFCSALISVLKLLVRAETAQSLLAWLMGSVGSEPWAVVWATVLYVATGATCLMLLAGRLHLMAQGDDSAARLGVNVPRTRMLAYLATSLLVAGVVAVTGLIGFIGLLVPHAVRFLWGPDGRLVIPVSALVGAGALVLCDGLARGLFAVWGTELPVGAITALLGSPAFIWLLRRNLRSSAGGAAS